MAKTTINNGDAGSAARAGINNNFTEVYTGQHIHNATAKTTPVDADEAGLIDSAASNVLKKVTWANVKAALKTYFDTLYVAARSFGTAAALDVGTTASKVVQLDGSGKMPAVDGSQLTGLSSAGPQVINITTGGGNCRVSAARWSVVNYSDACASSSNLFLNDINAAAAGDIVDVHVGLLAAFGVNVFEGLSGWAGTVGESNMATVLPGESGRFVYYGENVWGAAVSAASAETAAAKTLFARLGAGTVQGSTVADVPAAPPGIISIQVLGDPYCDGTETITVNGVTTSPAGAPSSMSGTQSNLISSINGLGLSGITAVDAGGYTYRINIQSTNVGVTAELNVSCSGPGVSGGGDNFGTDDVPAHGDVDSATVIAGITGKTLVPIMLLAQTVGGTGLTGCTVDLKWSDGTLICPTLDMSSGSAVYDLTSAAASIATLMGAHVGDSIQIAINGIVPTGGVATFMIAAIPI